MKSNNIVKNTRSIFWREWGPLIACALLTTVGLYGLVLIRTPLAAFILFALALGCPIAAGLAWWISTRKPAWKIPTLTTIHQSSQ